MTLILFFLIILFFLSVIICLSFLKTNRHFISTQSVAKSYDKWTSDSILENLWGEHIHLGYYKNIDVNKDFRKAKIDFVHELIKWSGLNNLPRGSRILDVGCGIGGSSRILAKDYGFDVLGITISPEQVNRARQLTPPGMSCRFEIMDALNLDIPKGSFDGVWSVEAGPHIPDKQRYADQMLRVIRPGGVLAIADWNVRDTMPLKLNVFEKLILRQLLTQWTHPEFSSINGFKHNLLNSPFNGGFVETEDWTRFTLPSWNESIMEGIRRPNAILKLGFKSLFKSFREVPTILMMRWAFATGLMQFGVFRSRG